MEGKIAMDMVNSQKKDDNSKGNEINAMIKSNDLFPIFFTILDGVLSFNNQLQLYTILYLTFLAKLLYFAKTISPELVP